jgi:dTMP kinase
MFITFEGIEGSGKSTQARRLAAAFGARAILTHEPGATAAGKEIRRILLAVEGSALSAVTETLLFVADRVQHVQEVIRPAIAAGKIVICDRFADSTRAYQCYGRGVPRRFVDECSDLALGGLQPEVTFLLDVDVAVGLARMRGRGAVDRMEAETRDFHDKVRAGYHALAAEAPERWCLIEGSETEERIAKNIRAILEQRGVRF